MAYYRAPAVFLFTLGFNSFLKAFFLRLCESFAAEDNLPISQALFMCFLLSCIASLSSLALNGKRKAWSYKLVTIVGGRENSPKLGQGLVTGMLYVIRVGGLITGSLLTSPFRAVMLTEYVALCLAKLGSTAYFDMERRFQKFVLSLLPVAICLFVDYQNITEPELSNYIKKEIIPELGVFSTKADKELRHPMEVLAFGYLCIFSSSIAQSVLGWIFEPTISSSLTTTAIGRRAVSNQILFFSLVQGLAASLVLPWLSTASVVSLGLGTLFLYLGLSFTVNLSDAVNFRISKLLPAHQNLPWVNWLVSIAGATFYCIFSSGNVDEPKSLFSFSDVLLVILSLLALYLARPDLSDKLGSRSDRVFVGLKESSDLSATLQQFLEATLASQDSKQIFYFLVLNLSYMFVQLAYGFWTNSLGLISDAIHMFFDCVALGVGIFAAVTSKWPKNNRFSYGYSRIEVLSGFSNGIFLALISIFIVLEALGRLIHPPDMNTDRLLLVSFLGLVVNLVGILAFNHGHHHGHGHSHCSSHADSSAHVHSSDHDHSHDHHHDHKHGHHHELPHEQTLANGHAHAHHSHKHEHAHEHKEHSHEHAQGHLHTHEDAHQHTEHDHSHGHGHSHNMEGVFLHIMADTLGSVGVIISTLLIKYFGWTGFDPLASIFIAVLIFFSVLPLIKSSYAILMLYVPPNVSDSLRQAASQAETSLDGSCKILDVKVWPNDHESYIVTVWIALSPGINSVSVSPHLEKIFLTRLSSIKELSLQFEVGA
ncbi:hypothetical protein DSO57_1006468 [Entomophthora muscae]|uniref:Uncharacterized protein n=1 Tax=Entomophthora muscae TaxID=34485 RepID=A0ACC2UTS2_9FUNG|nr:hypothetical protein DSO57_1006468 [Entomophthora muscae]